MTATMSKFKYVGETLDGQKIKGEIVAPTVNHARNELAIQGTRVTEISERKGLNAEITKTKVPAIEVMHFTRQMGTFLRAGVPMTEAIDSVRRGTENKRFAGILSDVLDRVTAGEPVTTALGRHDDIFPPYFMALLGSAELTGRMDHAFDQLHKYIKRDVALTKQVRKALIYPAILMVVAIGVVAIIVVFVIPKFADFFESFDATLPLPTRMLIAIADFVGSPAGLITGVVLFVAIAGTVAYTRTPTGRRKFHGVLLGVPVLNKVIVYSSTERFCRILAVLMEAGVPLGDALPNAIDCSNNLVFREKLTAATEGVLRGEGFTDPIARTEVFPTTMVQMVRVGERTGELTEQLDNVATFYEDELDYAVEKLTEWFEPIVILFIGVVVGFVALAMVSAMYGIYGQVDL